MPRLIRLLSLGITLPVTLAVVIFAIANRGPVSVDFWPFALAVVRGGARRAGERLYAFAQGRVTRVKVVSSVFIDPQGERHHG